MRIEPAEAFAEGGSLVLIHGRNFTNDTQFLFERRLSPSVRVLSPKLAMAVVPEFPLNEGGKTFVYVIEGRDKPKTEPGKPFLYQPKNKVKVIISEILDAGKIKRIQVLAPSRTGNLKKVNLLIRTKDKEPPEISTEDKRWNLKINHIKDDWYLLIAEWIKSGPAYGTLTFDLNQKPEDITPENQSTLEIVKIWAETTYHGRFDLEIIYQ